MEWTEDKIQFLNETKHLLCQEAYKLFCEKFKDEATTYRAFSVKKSRSGNCQAQNKKLKWKPAWLQYISGTKDMTTEEAYAEFKTKFPDADITLVAFRNQRSRSKAAKAKPHGSNKVKPLYAEVESKRYTMIKIAEPNVWISKARWVYEQAHPEETHEKEDQYFFKNGITGDYTPDNIIKVKKRERTLFLLEGGVDRDPEVTMLRLLRARMKLAQLNLGEKAGLVVQTSGGRRWK